MPYKHVVVERPRPDRVDEFTALGEELMALMIDRGWHLYTAWNAVRGDEGEPPLFDVGILGRALPPDGALFVFECEFPDLGSLEAQLQAMRNDPEVVKLLLRGPELIDPAASRAYILEAWAR